MKIRKDVFFTKKDCKVLDNIIINQDQAQIKKKFNYDIKFREKFRLGTYYGNQKGFRGAHIDTGPNFKHRKLSLVICLSDSSKYQGGIFSLLNLPGSKKKSFKFNRGDAIIFRSHLLHQVTPVTSGKRQVIISFMWDNDGEKIRNTEISREKRFSF